jgi:hypothetical protein
VVLWRRRIRGGFGDFIAFNKFVVWSWNGKLSLGEMCNTRKEGVVWKYICTYVLFQWKMVEEPSCVLCEFILLKNEDSIV